MMMTFYHGGVPGLLPGDFILPASITGAANTLDYLKATEWVERTKEFKKEPGALTREYRTDLGRMYRADRVYITPDCHYAIYMAILHQSGDFGIYEVEPIGEIETDPDWAHRPEVSAFVGLGEMKQCEKALVMDVVNLSDEAIARMRQLVMNPQKHIPNLAEHVASHAREQRETPEREQRRRDRRAFEKQQRKLAQRARKRG